MKKKTISRQSINNLVDINKLDIHFNKEDASPKIYKLSDKRIDQKVGSSMGGAYPYNVNSNTSDEINEKVKMPESKQGPNNSFNKQKFIESHKKNSR